MRDSQVALWEKLYCAANQQRLSQALFLVGPVHTGLDILTKQFIQLLFCKQGLRDYCSTCPDCQMVLRLEHPDLQWIKPEKTGGSIKIEEIRALQSTAYLTPTRAPRRVIVIEFADRLNRAAANALLKILEEPAAHTQFILIAEQLSNVPATVLSRCQIFYAVDTSTNKLGNNLLSLGELYKDDSDRSLIINNAEAILDDLIALIAGKEHPCIVAARWNQHELSSLSWFLYLIYAQLQLMFYREDAVLGLAHQQLYQLQSLLTPVIIFGQIDKLNHILKKLSHNININSQLALEDLLLSLMVESQPC